MTEKGRIATDPASPAEAMQRARIDLAIVGIGPSAAIYDRYKGSRLPSVEVLRDAAAGSGVDREEVAECVEIFLANARDVGLIRTIGGSEHLLPVADALDGLPGATEGAQSPESTAGLAALADFPAASTPIVSPLTVARNLQKTCFIISPIGEEGSDQRLHADLVLASLIEPALKDLNLEVVRADKISRPGLITGQVIEYLTNSALVIADLSFGNPNVYYELALRHATRKPVVQLIRSSDRLPFDVGQFRTVVIDMTSIYSLVPRIELHRQEITRQSRSALDEDGVAESPLSRFYPDFWDHVPRQPESR